jgi:hypothetical protein
MTQLNLPLTDPNLDLEGFLTMYSTAPVNTITPPDSFDRIALHKHIAYEREEAWIKGHEVGYRAGIDFAKTDYFIRGMFAGGFFVAGFILVMTLIFQT